MARSPQSQTQKELSYAMSESLSISDVLSHLSMRQIHKEKPLSVTARGVTGIVWDIPSSSRAVARVLMGEAKPSSMTSSKVLAKSKSGTRSYAFGTYAYEHRSEMKGIVPMRAPPRQVEQYMIEVYDELTMESFSNKRVNLHEFVCVSDIWERFPANHMFRYLFDVAVGMNTMHAHGWAHMDLSLANIVINDTNAFIIDFESTLPTRENFGYLRRAHLRQVPMKVTFLPPEHFIANGDEWVSLQDYDVWAFGCMVFYAVFNKYLLPYETIKDNRGKTKYVLKANNFECFVNKGFEMYLVKFMPRIHRRLFGERTTRFALLCDLLSNIFVLATPKNTMGKAIIWKAPRRYNAAQISKHPFWSTGCKVARRRKRSVSRA